MTKCTRQSSPTGSEPQQAPSAETPSLPVPQVLAHGRSVCGGLGQRLVAALCSRAGDCRLPGAAAAAPRSLSPLVLCGFNRRARARMPCAGRNGVSESNPGHVCPWRQQHRLLKRQRRPQVCACQGQANCWGLLAAYSLAEPAPGAGERA